VRATGIDVIWDYFHYGFPDDLDILSEEFPVRFGRFAAAASEYLMAETGRPLAFCPVNEISFFAWAAGRAGIFYPFKKTKAAAIKRQLVRAAITAIDTVREVCPDVRVIITEPAIHVIPASDSPAARRGAASYSRSQFEALDMLAGKRDPELGGAEKYLDIIGLNYYVHNQWTYPGRRTVWPDDPRYRQPHQIFMYIYERYRRPMILAETGIEDDERASWFRFITAETDKARSAGVPLNALCLYPIVDHPGWVDGRHCRNGLWGYPDDHGGREAYIPLESAIREHVAAQSDDAVAGRGAGPFAATGK
jgi:beta-glucosidase/6-phospho-beta-glucosidase/beta-galactosidase